MNRKIQFSIFSTLLIFLLATFSQAQQTISPNEQKISEEKQALIKEYFDVVGGREAVNKSLDAVYANLDNVLPMLLSTMVEQNKDLTASQKSEMLKELPEMIARIGKRFRNDLNQEIDFAKLVEDINYPLLDKFFTESELKDLIVFYKSPTGQKAILVQPQLFTEASTRLNAVLIPALQKVMKKTTDAEVAELVKKAKRNK